MPQPGGTSPMAKKIKKSKIEKKAEKKEKKREKKARKSDTEVDRSSTSPESTESPFSS
jgi:hypothetical protein